MNIKHMRINNAKEMWAVFMWLIGKRLENASDFFYGLSSDYWRGYCKSCGIEAGYGHKNDCPEIIDR